MHNKDHDSWGPAYTLAGGNEKYQTVNAQAKLITTYETIYSKCDVYCTNCPWTKGAGGDTGLVLWRALSREQEV